MQVRRALAALFLSLLATTGLAAQDAPPKRRVAVLDFDYATVHAYVTDVFGSDVDIGKGIADMIVTNLVRDGNYSVIERKQLDAVLSEQNFQQSGRADASSAAQLGRLLGVDAIIIGSITQFGRDDKKLGVGGGVRVGGIGIGGVGTRSAKAVVGIDARIVSIQTAEILAVATGKGESKRSGMTLAAGVGGSGGGVGGVVDMGSSNFQGTIIGEATKAAVDSLTGQLLAARSRIAETKVPVSGLVADVAGNELIINIGTAAGLRVGGEYDVVRPGREVKDPATGRVIRRMTTPVGKIKITSADAESGVGTLSGTGGPARVGDCVGTCPAAGGGGGDDGGSAAAAAAPALSGPAAAVAASSPARASGPLPAMYSAPVAGAFAWVPYAFKGTEHFKYDVVQGAGNDAQRGTYTFDATPAGNGRVRLMVDGTLGEDRYQSSVTVGPNEGIPPMALAGLGPVGAMLFAPTWAMMFGGREWEVGSFWSMTQGGETTSFKVESPCQAAGVSGLRGVARRNNAVALDMCVSPQVALPLALTMGDEGDTMSLKLVEFRP